MVVYIIFTTEPDKLYLSSTKPSGLVFLLTKSAGVYTQYNSVSLDLSSPPLK